MKHLPGIAINRSYKRTYTTISSVIVAATTVVVGMNLLLETHAASPYGSVEAENGTINGAAAKINDAAASNGSVVRFGNTISSSGTGSAPKFEPANGKVYIGVSTDHNVSTGGSDRLATFDTTLGINQPAIFNEYTAKNGSFSSTIANATKGPYMTPEVSWGLTFAGGQVTNGSMDANIAARIAEVKAFGKPMFVRLDWEFNGSWYPDWNNPAVTPAQYIASWQYVVTKFAQAGVSNVAWVWCPNVLDYFDTTGARFVTSGWYPGDAYVDWIGLDAYPQSNTQNELLTGKDGMDQMAQFAAAHGKPLMLNEWALNTPHPDDPTVVDWVLAWQDAYPSTIKANLWFDFITQGKDFTLVDHPLGAAAFKAKVAANPSEYVTTPIQ